MGGESKDPGAETALAAIGCLFVVPAALLGGVAVFLYRGWALSLAWGWLAVPLLELRPLGIGTAAAALLLVESARLVRPDGSKDRDWGDHIGKMMLFPLLYLAMAWLLHRAIMAGWVPA
jgi:hypothetical protein